MRASPLLLLALCAALLAGCRAPLYEPSEDVEILIRGNEAFSDTELLQVMAEDLRAFEERGFPRSAIDDAAWQVEGFYRDAGYPEVEVAYRHELVGRPRPRAIFTVSEGPRVAITRVVVIGAAAFDAQELAAFVLRPRRIFRRVTTWFVEGRVANARVEIESLYIEEGYTDVAVAEPTVEFGPDRRTATVTLAVNEGLRRMLRGVEYEGVSPELLGPVQDAVAGQLNQPWFPRRAYFLRAAVREQYAQRGHPEAEVDVIVPDPLPTEVVPRVVVRPGPRIRIGQVHVSGNERTRERYIRGRLRLREGEVFDRRRERESFSRLLATGLFRQVEILREPRAVEEPEAPVEPVDSVEPVEPPDEPARTDEPVESDEPVEPEPPEGIRLPDAPAAPPAPAPEDDPEDDHEDEEELHDIRVELLERPAREIFVEPGYGSYEMLRLRVGAADRNVLGTGQTLRAEAGASQRSLRGELGYIWPTFLDSDLVLDGRLFAGERQEPSFVRRDLGTEWRLTRTFTRHIKTTLGYEFRQSAARDIDVLLEEPEEVLLSIFSLSPSFDSRDSLFWPTGGTLVRLRTEWTGEPIGSELDYTRLLANVARYHEVGRNLVVAWSYRTGLIFPLADTEVIPIQERFFNGGESTVRSFGESQLGPKDEQGEPIGGEAFNVGSAELRWRFSPSWQAAFFVDVGNVIPQVADWYRFDDLRYGVGAGLRWLLPIGPIRLDLGVNPTPRADEDDFRIHFSVGSPY